MKKRILILCFGMPVLVAGLAFVIRGIAPFGKVTLCAIDGWGQYFPMLREAERNFFSGKLLPFMGPQLSFSGALAFDLTAQSAYYTNSPFWIILYLIPGEITAAQADLMILFKFGLAGLGFGIFLTELWGEKRWTPVLSSAWALSGYTLAFINQVMWMDAVIFLPLIILGIEKLFLTGKPWVYLIFLTLTICACFYTAYMVCIFCVIWAGKCVICGAEAGSSRRGEGRSICEKRSGRLMLFFGVSLLSGLLSLPVLLPLLKALRLTIASTLTFEGKLKLYRPLWESFKMFLPGMKPSLEYGDPNVFCTITALFGAFLFFTGKIPKRSEKWFFGAVSGFLWLSFDLNALDYFWHGFHYPNQLPGRFSFVFIFVLLYLAGRGVTERIDDLFSGNMHRRTGHKLDKKGLWVVILSGLLLGEVIANTIVAVQYAPCTGADFADKYQTVLKENRERITPDLSSGEFFRTELTEHRDNGGLLWGYNGISWYSSTMSEAAYTFFTRLGLPIYAKNVSTWYEPSEELNAFFGIRYLISEEGITENEAVFPLGFTAPETVLELDGTELSGKALQKALMTAILKDDALYRNGRLDLRKLKTGCEALKNRAVRFTSITPDRLSGTMEAAADGPVIFTLPAELYDVYIDGKKQEKIRFLGYLLAVRINAGEHRIELKHASVFNSSCKVRCVYNAWIRPSVLTFFSCPGGSRSSAFCRYT